MMERGGEEEGESENARRVNREERRLTRVHMRKQRSGIRARERGLYDVIE